MEKGRLIIDGVDVSGSVGSAASVPYSNTNSGLEATNTQGAIDELATSVTELNSNLYQPKIGERKWILTACYFYAVDNNRWVGTALLPFYIPSKDYDIELISSSVDSLGNITNYLTEVIKNESSVEFYFNETGTYTTSRFGRIGFYITRKS